MNSLRVLNSYKITLKGLGTVTHNHARSLLEMVLFTRPVSDPFHPPLTAALLPDFYLITVLR